jgi:hypothetical protein
MCTHLSDNIHIQNGLKQGDALSTLLSNGVFEFVIWNVQENHVGVKLNETNQFLAYADDVNLVGYNIITPKNTETLIDASKEDGRKLNVTIQSRTVCPLV